MRHNLVKRKFLAWNNNFEGRKRRKLEGGEERRKERKLRVRRKEISVQWRHAASILKTPLCHINTSMNLVPSPRTYSSVPFSSCPCERRISARRYTASRCPFWYFRAFSKHCFACNS
jgi:hypothetical protein